MFICDIVVVAKSKNTSTSRDLTTHDFICTRFTQKHTHQLRNISSAWAELSRLTANTISFSIINCIGTFTVTFCYCSDTKELLSLHVYVFWNHIKHNYKVQMKEDWPITVTLLGQIKLKAVCLAKYNHYTWSLFLHPHLMQPKRHCVVEKAFSRRLISSILLLHEYTLQSVYDNLINVNGIESRSHICTCFRMSFI